MELKINSINDFAKHKSINKIIYSSMNYKEKRKLKYYVYYEMQIKEDIKNLIWEYLNEPIGTPEYIYTSIILSKYKKS